MTNSSPFCLTRQQRNFFDTFGYLVLPGLMKDSIENITAAFEDLYQQNDKEIIDWRHEAHYMKSRRVLMQFIERQPQLAALLDDPLINGLFSSLLGENYLYRASDGNVFSGDTYWHSDLYGAFFKYRHIKILFYLDPLNENNGAFQAIPGSHILSDTFGKLCERYVWKHEERLGLEKHQVPCVTIPTQPGDVLIFDYRLKHATSNTQHSRRMFSICASERFAEEDMPKLAELTGMLLHMTGGTLYYPDFVANATDSQRAHIDQCLEALRLVQDGKVGNPVA